LLLVLMFLLNRPWPGGAPDLHGSDGRAGTAVELLSRPGPSPSGDGPVAL